MLPKIEYPIQEFRLPSTGETVRMRMMKARDEKVLLTAQNSKDYPSTLLAIVQVVSNCLVSPVEYMTVFDLEYLFLRLRAVSVSNIAKVGYIDEEDGQTYSFEVDLGKVEVQFPEDPPPNVVTVNDEVELRLKWPPASVYMEREVTSGEAPMEYLVAKCIHQVKSPGVEAIDTSKVSTEELRQFVLDLDTKTYTALIQYINNMPRLYHRLEYVNSFGNPRSVEMSTLGDFFTLQ